MTRDDEHDRDLLELARLTAELDAAEAYEQTLRALIAEVRDHLAAGRTGIALSRLNQALTFIDDQTDVVAPSPVAKDPRGDA
jgi:hypothetical protein